MLNACVTLAACGLETIAMSGKQHEKLQARQMAGVKRVDERNMDEGGGLYKWLMRRLVKSRLKSAGHIEIMMEDHLIERMEGGGTWAWGDWIMTEDNRDWR